MKKSSKKNNIERKETDLFLALDVNLMSSIFSELVDKFDDQFNFSLTSKIFFDISKTTFFKFNLCDQKLLINYQIYHKLSFIQKKFTGEAETKTVDDFLLYASLFGFASVIPTLISKGANPNCVSQKKKNSPLCCSSLGGFTNSSKQLIANGADLNFYNKEKLTPFLISVKNGRNDLSKTYLDQYNVDINQTTTPENGPVLNALFVAIKYINMDFISYLCTEKNIDINATYDFNDDTPLIAAVETGNYKLVQHLLDLGSNTEQTSVKGFRTPLTVAANNCSGGKILKCLMDAGADLYQENGIGETPIYIINENMKELKQGLVEDPGRKLMTGAQEMVDYLNEYLENEA